MVSKICIPRVSEFLDCGELRVAGGEGMWNWDYDCVSRVARAVIVDGVFGAGVGC